MAVLCAVGSCTEQSTVVLLLGLLLREEDLLRRIDLLMFHSLSLSESGRSMKCLTFSFSTLQCSGKPVVIFQSNKRDSF